jgi:hypothetical protein
MGAITWWDGVSDAAASAGNPAQLFGGGEGPLYAENPWELVTLNGQKLPGLCTVEGLPTLKIDQKKKGGADSVTFTATGYLPGPINVECMIWTLAQWQLFQTVAGLIWRKPNKKAKASDLAITIEHPGLTLWGISQVIVSGVSTPEDGPIKQSKIIRIRCLEYVPPGRGDKTKTAKSTSFARDPGIPTLNKPTKPSDTPPGPHG